jgi:Tol biopolymer transport system component
MRLPLDLSADAGQELVIGPPFYVQQMGWSLTGNEIVFTDGSAKGEAGSLRAYEITTHKTRLIVPFLRSFGDGRNYSVTVSPDGKWILYAQLDHSGSNVIVAENQ